jgi:ATP-dependent protease ClpP protease subunit
MARDQNAPPTSAPPEILRHPQISLIGDIDKFTIERFLDQLREAERSGGDIAMELTTLGGDAELARRLVLDVEDARSRAAGRFLFLGKTVVYSAGVTIMSAFPREDRWLSRDAMVMIHCRKLEKRIEVSGPMRASLHEIEALRAQILTGLELEEQNFRRLIKGSNVSIEDLCSKALHNWYLTAEEAVERGLVAGILG